MQNEYGLKVKLFADGADLESMLEMNTNPNISGLTTNPTLMRKAGITNYVKFAREILTKIETKPISFEVFSDNLEEMVRQGLEIASWGENVYVKIPVTNTEGKSTGPVVEKLVSSGVKVNVTAVFTVNQIKRVSEFLSNSVPSYVSVFAGRIADTGQNPVPIMVEALEILKSNPSTELIWASPRELLNIIQADEILCHIITATPEILGKLSLLNKNLDSFSLETVKMFYNDAKNSNYEI